MRRNRTLKGPRLSCRRRCATRKTRTSFGMDFARALSRLSRPIMRRSTFATQKIMGRDDFTKIPNGIPSLEDRVNLLLHSRRERRAHRSAPVRRYGEARTRRNSSDSSRERERSSSGSDADLVVYDPNYRGKISAKTHQMNLDYNSFEGFEIEGRPHVVTVRGKVAVRDGKFVGDIHRGKFLSRPATHF